MADAVITALVANGVRPCAHHVTDEAEVSVWYVRTDPPAYIALFERCGSEEHYVWLGAYTTDDLDRISAQLFASDEVPY